MKEAARQYGKAPRVFLREIALGILPAPKAGVADAPWIRDLGRSATALTRLVAMARASGALPLASTFEAALAEHMAIIRQVASDNRRVRRP